MRLQFLRLFALFIVLLAFMACDKDDSNTEDPITAADVAEIKTIMSGGEWHVSYFFDTDKDETDNFIGYGFTFNASGALGATDGNTALSGAWSITVSDTDDDDSGNDDVDFNIVFNAPDDFEELSEDWHIIKYTKSKIELNHVSGGGGGTDYLTFEKN